VINPKHAGLNNYAVAHCPIIIQLMNGCGTEAVTPLKCCAEECGGVKAHGPDCRRYLIYSPTAPYKNI